MKGKTILKKLICLCLVVSMIISAVPANEVFAGVVESIREEIVVEENANELNENLEDSIVETSEKNDSNDEETSEKILGKESTDVLVEEYSSEENDEIINDEEIIEIPSEEGLISEEITAEEDVISELDNDCIGAEAYSREKGSYASVNDEGYKWKAEEAAMDEIFKNYHASATENKNLTVSKYNEATKKYFYAPQLTRDGQGYCNRAAIVNIMHRRVWLEQHNDNWMQIAATNIAGVHNYSSKSQYQKYGIDFDVKIVEKAHALGEKSVADLKDKIKKKLDEHPEGIAIRTLGHWITITGYNGDQFYAIDPVDNRDFRVGRIRIEETYELYSKLYDKKSKTSFDAFLDYLYNNGTYDVATVESKNEVKPLHKHNYVYENNKTEPRCNVSGCTNPQWKEVDHLDGNFKSGYYTITSKLNVYSGTATVAGKNGLTIDNGEVVYISKAMFNPWGNSWGYVDSKKGWICVKGEEDSDYKFKIVGGSGSGSTQTAHTVDFSPMNVPSNGHKGAYNLTTVITCKSAVIEEITGQILNQNNSVVQKKTVKGNGTGTFKVLNSGINVGSGCLAFGSLSAGIYKYKYIVRLKGVDKTYEKTSSEFTIGQVTKLEKPEISHVRSSVGKLVYKISKPGYIIKYSLNGGTYSQFTDSKDIEITSNTTIRAYTYAKSGSSSSNYIKSDEVVKSVTIEKVRTPEISYTQNSDGTTVSIAVGGSYNTIYYKTNNGSYSKYSGPFTITSKVTVSAYAENTGMVTSDIANKEVSVSVPDIPNVTLVSKSDIAEGDAVTISWSNDSKAKSFTINVKKDNGSWKSFTTDTAYYAFNTEGSGIYSVYVVANNAIGSSSNSNTVSCEAHDPSTVRFIDWDDSVIGTPQIVRYGCSATKPLSPKRRGYTFAGWDGQYTNVIKDTDIKAEYEINTYIVKFYDVTGKKYLGEQDITFDTSIDAEEFKSKVVAENPGRHFTGWEIYNVKDDESYLDLEHVDSDMLVRAVTTWTSDTMPCLISNVSSTPITVNGEIGFRVNSTVNSTEKKDLKAKILVSLYSDRGNDVYRMIKTSTKEAMIKADTSNIIEPIDITYDGTVKADKIMVSVVSIEGTDRTGGLIAEPKYYDVPEGSYKYYSGWITAEEAAEKGYSITGSDVQVRTTYRSRVNTRKTTGWTRSATAPEGYKLLDSVKRTGSWSSWSDSKYTSSTLRDVESKNVIVTAAHTEYRYGCWSNGAHTYWCPNSGYKAFKGSWSLKYTGWSTSRTSGRLATTENNGKLCPYKVNGCNRSSQHIGYNSSHNDSRGYACDYWSWVYHPTSSGEDYYWEETKQVSAVTKTQYRYRDNYYEYDYYTFEQGWWDNEWSENEIKEVHTSFQDIDVQSRKEYNILLGSVPPSDSTGEIMNIKGSLNDTNLSDKTAIVLIYKEKNTDPTESQIEYIGKTKLDSNGGYEFNFITKDDPNKIKSDFVVALAVEGSDNYLNVDSIRYKRNEYTVKYVVDDIVIKEVTVEEGENVEAPESVDKEGYDFIGWDKNTTNIKSNLIVVAQFKPKKYSIVFVDYENRTTNLTSQEYGSPITIPTDMSELVHKGFTFDGWDVEENAIVSGDTIIVAKWTPDRFTVVFKDPYGNTINTQENIEYGSSAQLPKLNVAENLLFLGWDESEEWWNVTEDMEVYPIIVDKNKLDSPTSNMDFESEGDGNHLILDAKDGADIYYTLDGSNPSVDGYNLMLEKMEDEKSVNFSSEYSDSNDDFADSFDDEYGTTYKYDGPIALVEDCTVRAIAVAPEYQDSDIAEFSHSMEYSEPERGELVEVATENVYLKSGEKVKLAVDFKGLESIYSGELLINAGNAMIYPYYDNEENIGMKVSEEFSKLGDIDVNMANENGNIDFVWAGSDAVSNPNRMFMIDVCVDEETTSGNYPISILYAPKYTLDKDCEQLNLEGKVSLVVNPEETPGEADKTHVITYVLNGGTNNSGNPSEYTEGKEVVLRDPTRSNYKFAGWYDNASFTGNKITVVRSTSKTDITLYAKWEELDTKEGLWFNADLSDIEYNGMEIKPDISVYWGSEKLTLGTDYSLTYQNNIKAASKNSGKAPTITITGKGEYTKSYKKTFTINQKDLSDCDYVDNLVVQNNTKVTPIIVCNGILLKTTDYDMYKVTDRGSYAIKATEKWTSDGVLRLIGKGNFKGTVDIDVYVSNAKPQMINATVSNEKLYYDGDEKLPLVSVFDKASKKSLTEYLDYLVFTSDDKIDAGTHKIVIAGVGDYSGVIQKSYVINPIQKTSGRMQVEYLGDAVYNGRGSVPDDITVKYNYSSSDYYYLEEGKDYTLKYSNNKKVGYGKITVSFIGNYKGRPVETKEYRIVSNSLYDAAVLIPDKTNCNDKGVFKQKPVISVGGVKLSASDYNVTYYVDDSYSKSAEMTSSNPIRIGSEGYATVWVRIEGVGNYKDTVETSYNVYKKLNKGSSIIDLSKATVSIKNASTIAFENKEIQPEIDRVTVGGRTIKSDYYTVSYAINVYKGTASVMVTGDGENVIGSKVATFAIKPYDVNNIKE